MITTLDHERIVELLLIAAKHDIHSYIWWKEEEPGELAFFINCNDLFAWGVADCEPIVTRDDITALDQACQDAGVDGPELYCARRRKMRPQGALYEYLEPSSHPLFDACGPFREAGFGNPVASGNPDTSIH